jgi:hypothetical protein
MRMFHLTFDDKTDEFILWKSDRNTEVVRIPMSDALSLAATLVQEKARQQDSVDRLPENLQAWQYEEREGGRSVFSLSWDRAHESV